MKINFKPKQRRELDLIGLINAVFLLLVFFVVTGTIQTRAPSGIELAASEDGALRPAPPNAIALNSQGEWIVEGVIAGPEGVAAWIAGQEDGAAIEIWVDSHLEAMLFQERIRDTQSLAGRIIKVITMRSRTQ
ncbi:MAG: biopolymer transporter ExbD [Rhizobiales bacterium]|nr:biopolymer transporter ExbD [Hyphomicrobiales bacterium]